MFARRNLDAMPGRKQAMPMVTGRYHRNADVARPPTGGMGGVGRKPIRPAILTYLENTAPPF
jgi:hypothetical protein